MNSGRFGRLPRALLGLALESWARTPLAPGDRCTGDPKGLVVALTTFPARGATAHLAIRTILKGSEKPSKVLVVLSKEQYPTGPPSEIEDLRDRGVEVLMDDGDSRSYKKLIPVRAKYQTATVVTADDDVYYRPDWLARFERCRRKYRGEILGLRGNLVSAKDGQMLPYTMWPDATPESSWRRTVLKGVGGILYPPDSLPDEAFDISRALALAPTADDLWFKVMSLQAGTPARRITYSGFQTPPIRGSQSVSLRAVNVDQGANDKQFHALLSHYDLWDTLLPRSSA